VLKKTGKRKESVIESVLREKKRVYGGKSLRKRQVSSREREWVDGVWYTGWVQKSKLLILSEYVNKTEKIGGMWTNKNSYRENEVLSDIFTWNILRHSCFVFKYSVTESNQWNYC